MEIRSSSPHPRILARVSKRREKKKKRQRLPCHRSNKFERRSIQPLSISFSFSFSFSLVSSFISAIQLLSPIFATMEAAEIELRIFSLLESPPPLLGFWTGNSKSMYSGGINHIWYIIALLPFATTFQIVVLICANVGDKT